MNFKYLFTSLGGRINRAQWWAGTIILFVVSKFLVGIIAGFSVNFDLRFAIILVTLVYLTLFPLTYAVAAKRFQDRNKPGSRSLYGLIPWLIANLFLAGCGLTDSLGESNTFASICSLISLGVSLWFLIELGMLKGDSGPNRFDGDPLTTDAVYSVLEAKTIIGGRLFAYLVCLAGAVVMVAVCNSILGAMSVPQSLLLDVLLKGRDELTLMIQGAVLLIAAGCALVGVFLATPFARLALRVWPVDPFGGWTVRYWVIVAFGVLCLIPVVAFFSLTFVGLFNWSTRFALETGARGIRNESMLQQAVVRLGWSSTILGVFCIFYWAHMRATYNVRRPFALFLRRFSGFADRSLVVDLIKSMPKGVPLAFVASRADQARNWDPFVWAFGGLRLLKPLTNLPIQIRTIDKDWTITVEKLLQNAKCVIVDLSDRSPSVEIERQLIDKSASRDRVVALVDARSVVNGSSDYLSPSAIRYSPSFLNSAVRCLVKAGLVLFIAAKNPGVWGGLVLFSLPFLLMPSVSRAERKEIHEAVRRAVNR